MARTLAALPWLADSATPDSEWGILHSLSNLTSKDPALVRELATRPWLVDEEASEEEGRILHYLNDLASSDLDLARTLTGYPWLAGEIVTSIQGGALHALRDIASKDLELARTLAVLPWLADEEASEEEGRILHYLNDLASRDLELARTLAGYPWLAGESVTSIQGESLHAIAEIAAEDLELAKIVAASSWVMDEVTEDEWRALVRLNESAPETARELVEIAEPPRGLAHDPGQWDVVLLVILRGGDQDVLDWRTDRDEVEDFDALWLASAARLIAGLTTAAWAQDGIDHVEGSLLSSLRWRVDPSGEEDESAFLLAVRKLTELPWVTDGLSEAERLLISGISPLSSLDIVDARIRLASALLGEPWIRDGIVETERLLLTNIGWLTEYEDEASAIGAVRNLVNTPWIADGLTDSERDIIEGFAFLLSRGDITQSHQAARLFTEAAWIQDGLGESEYWVLMRILGGPGVPLALRTIGEPDFVITTEERVIDLPHSGPMPLVIIREGQGASRSMDDLEYAVRGVEALLGERLPTEIVRVLFDPFEGIAAHLGSFISMPAGTEGSDWYAGAIIHEVGHYYFGSRRRWITEGAAGIIEDIVDFPRTDRAIDANNHPCVHTTTIAEFEVRGTYACSYAFGKRIFADLYRTLGPELFRKGFGNLYLAISSPEGDNVDGFRAAFKAVAPDHVQAIDAIVDRWYFGPPPRGVLPLDERQPDPYLAAFDVTVLKAEIVLPDGTPAPVLSSYNEMGGPSLKLSYEFPSSSEPRNISLTTVGHFEDGFAFYRTYRGKRQSTIPAGVTQHSEVIALSYPDPSLGLAPGQYWVFVYHDEQKVAETSFFVEE